MHNGFYDFMFVLNTLNSPLPEDVETFKVLDILDIISEKTNLNQKDFC